MILGCGENKVVLGMLVPMLAKRHFLLLLMFCSLNALASV